MTTIQVYSITGFQRHNYYLQKSLDGKVRSYIALYPVLGTVQSSPSPLVKLFIPMPSRLLWVAHRTQPRLHLQRKDYLFTYPPLSISRYSFILLSELRQRGVSKTAQASKQQQEDTNPGSLDGE